ncbi:MAG: FAD-binding oxidoreductase [Paucibacter sp.]|nr:FAD-binding oxidoreductase [Roseateles sp.]
MISAIESAVLEWQTLLGAPQVRLDADSLAPYANDTTGTRRRIPVALRPLSAQHIPAILRIAQHYKTPIYPISTGNNWGYGSALPAQDDCVLLDLSQLQEIKHFDAELGVVTVEPGVTQGMLAAFLEAGSHPFLVPVTGAGPNCSLLGNALERGYGVTPHTDHFGAVTDLEAVLADGSIYRSALREAGAEETARLFKWGIGPYFDGLFTQSGFGVVTQISIALARRPQSVKICLFSLDDDALLEQGVDCIQRILRSLPGIVGGANLMNRHRMLAMAAPYPRDSIGPDGLIPAALIETMGKQYQIRPWTGFITLYGSKRVVAAAQADIKAILSGCASRVLFLSGKQAQDLARLAKLIPGQSGQRLARTASTLALSLDLVNGKPNETALPLAYWRNPAAPKASWRDPARDGCGLIWYAPLVPMRAEAVRQYVSMTERITRAHGIEPLITLTSVNDKVFDSTVPILFNASADAEADSAKRCYQNLLDEGAAANFLPYRIGVSSMPWLSNRLDASRHVHQRLKEALDPLGILLPGRYL